MKKSILFLLILTIVGAVIACLLTAIKEPLWKAGAEIQIYMLPMDFRYPTDVPSDIPDNRVIHNGNNSFNRAMKLLKSDYLADRVAKAIKEQRTKIGRIESETLKSNLEISGIPSNYSIWIYYTCNDPKIAQEVVNYYIGEMLFVVKEEIRKHPQTISETRLLQIQHKNNEIAELESRLEKLPAGDSSERTLVEKSISEATNLSTYLKKQYEMEKDQIIAPPITVTAEEAQLISEYPINKHFAITGALGALCGLCMGGLAVAFRRDKSKTKIPPER